VHGMPRKHGRSGMINFARLKDDGWSQVGFREL